MRGRLESEARAYLSGERNSDGGAGTEEISQSSAGHAQLIQAGDRLGCGAGGIGADVGDVSGGHLILRNGQGGDVRDVIRAGIVAVKKIEELDERRESPALVEIDRPADAQVALDVRSSAKFIQGCRDSVDHCPIVDAVA